MTFDDCRKWIERQAYLYRYAPELPHDPIWARESLALSMGEAVAASLDAEAMKLARDLAQDLPDLADLPDPDPYDVDVVDLTAA